MTLRFYDTATREVRDFVPLEEGKAGIYVCGLTVQSEPHVGHDIVQLPLWVTPFVATMRGGDEYRWKRRLRLMQFIHFLQQQGIIPVPPLAPPSPDGLDVPHGSTVTA